MQTIALFVLGFLLTYFGSLAYGMVKSRNRRNPGDRVTHCSGVEQGPASNGSSRSRSGLRGAIEKRA